MTKCEKGLKSSENKRTLKKDLIAKQQKQKKAVEEVKQNGLIKKDRLRKFSWEEQLSNYNRDKIFGRNEG